ncbi:MAG: response regulator [Actinobacteria bacterium]|nr:response regulator [Actinomycetota bacterium]
MKEEALHILIVDDDRRMANTLSDILNVKGYNAEVAYSGRGAIKKVESGSFDCIITDVKMPDIDGVKFYKTIKVRKPDIPVVLMTAYSTDSLVKEGLDAGVVATLTKPLDINAILSFLSMLKKENTIVIVDDDPKFAKTLAGILKKRGFIVIEVTDISNLDDTLIQNNKIVVLDMKLGSVNGLDVLKDIKKKHPDMPVILITGYRKEMSQSIKKALDIKAYTCLYKPLHIEKLLEVLVEVKKKELGMLLGRSFT